MKEQTKLQKFKAALRILKKDCELEGEYCKGRKTCAIGALALASGVKRADLALIEGESMLTWESDVKRVQEAITKKFGFTTGQMIAIQQANDDVCVAEHRKDHVKVRRKSVCGLVQRWINRLKG